MKIKQDFVTNSSSTSYIAFIPDNFDVSKFEGMIRSKFSHIINDCIEMINSADDDHMTFGQFLSDTYEKFEEFIQNGFVEEYDNIHWYLMTSIINELELVIAESSVNSDNGMVENINYKEYKDKIDAIKSGGWGIKYGGWGHESKA